MQRKPKRANSGQDGRRCVDRPIPVVEHGRTDRLSESRSIAADRFYAIYRHRTQRYG